MTRMFNPPHPGLTLRDDVLPALGLNVTDAAKQLDVSRVALSRVVNGRAAATVDNFSDSRSNSSYPLCLKNGHGG